MYSVTRHRSHEPVVTVSAHEREGSVEPVPSGPLSRTAPTTGPALPGSAPHGADHRRLRRSAPVPTGEGPVPNGAALSSRSTWETREADCPSAGVN